jgi:hypothetical protein
MSSCLASSDVICGVQGKAVCTCRKLLKQQEAVHSIQSTNVSGSAV